MNERMYAKIHNPSIIAGQIRIKHSGQVAMVVESKEGGTFNVVDLMLGTLVYDNWVEAEDCDLIHKRYPQVLKEPRELRWTL